MLSSESAAHAQQARARAGTWCGAGRTWGRWRRFLLYREALSAIHATCPDQSRLRREINADSAQHP
eukprot:1698367-Rhodomonas_salina.1